ncbi:MAG: hypothetical protein ABFC94_07395 [Syntrophomonas sp.]
MTISYSDFKQLPTEQQKDTLEVLRNEIGISALIKSWGISRSKIYNIIHDLGLSVSPKNKKSKTNENETHGKTKKKQSISQQNKLDVKGINSAQHNIAETSLGNLPFSVSLTAQGSFQAVSEKLQYLFQQNVPNTNVRITVNIDEI